MILGLSSPLSHNNADEWGLKHAELGCKALVFPLSCNNSDEEIDAYVKAAKSNNLTIAEVGIWKNVLAADEKERQEAVNYSIGQLKLADKINAKCCVNIVGTPYGPRWDGGYAGNLTEEAWKMAVDSIQYIIDEAKPVNTKFTIETMPWMLPSSPDEYLRLIEEVNRPEFGVHLDIVNMINCPERYFFNEKFMEDTFDKLGDKILSCHIKDVNLLEGYTFQLKESACGDGHLSLEKYAELANRYNPEMPMIIEHLNTDEEYLASLSYVKERLKDYLR